MRARSSLREMIPKSLASSVEFYDPQAYCNAAPVRDNLLFGRVAYGIANAQEQVSAVMKSALADSGFLNTVYRIGLDYQIGAHGRLLFPRQRAARRSRALSRQESGDSRSRRRATRLPGHGGQGHPPDAWPRSSKAAS